MAGVVRLSSGRIIQRYFCNFASQTLGRNFKLKQRICFHTSSLLSSQEVKMPSLSPTMTEGTIIQWLKKEGDAVAPGDVLCEIQTDKAVMAFETEEEGILAKILVQPGTKDVKVGTLIALMVEEGEDWKSVNVTTGASAASAGSGGGGAPSSGQGSPPSGDQGSSSSASGGGNVPGQAVKMPALSPTMSEGTIVSWKKKEGDILQPGDALCEIQTDKAVMTFEFDEEGILAKIMMKEGTVVKVGEMIAITVATDADWTKVKVLDVLASTGSSEAAAPAAAAPPPLPTGGSVPGQTIVMPSLSPTMSEGQIVNWLKKEGDQLKPGDVLCEIQTDKAVMAFEFEEEAVLAKILVQANSGPVKVGQLIAMTVEEGKDWKDVAIPAVAPAPAAAAATATAAPAAPKPAAAAPVHTGFHLEGDFAPSVRALLERYQLTGKEITPTGRKKKILKGDVLKYINDNKLQPKPPQAVPLPGQKPGAPPAAAAAAPGKPATAFTDRELSTMRKVIAQRLTQSKTEIPHAYSTLSAQIDSLMSSRKELANLGVKVSVNDFVVKAVARALKQCPYMNATYVKERIVPSPTVDISIAVATPNGLITPIIKNADQKSVDQISAEVKVLAVKARDGKLQPQEFQGGSFTISNLGMFGVTEFSAIINPPQCGILAIGGGRTIIKPDGKPATLMCATLSYDSRAVAEDEVAAFMEVVTGFLQNPASLLLNGPVKPKVISMAESIL